MTVLRQGDWPWTHAIGLALAGALFAYWNWVGVLGGSAEVPVGYAPEDVWMNKPAQARLPLWVPIWSPSIVLGTVGFMLAGPFLQSNAPQTFRTIRACFVLNVLASPFNIALNELVAEIYVSPPGPWYAPAYNVAMAFVEGLGVAAMVLGAHGLAWAIGSVVIGCAIAQSSRAVERLR